MKLIGNKEAIAFCVGKLEEGSKQNMRIDLWVKGTHINSVDNLAYLPCYYGKLKDEIELLEKNELKLEGSNSMSIIEAFGVMRESDINEILSYDITLNDAKFYAFELGSKYRITFFFWNHNHETIREDVTVFSLDVEKTYLINLLKILLDLLPAKWV